MRGMHAFMMAGLVVARLSEAQPSTLRPFTPADLLSIERIDEVVPSPNGQGVAIVLIRARTSANAPPRFLMTGYDRADVWLAKEPNGTPAALTEGAIDGSGFYFPTWSPDGRRLAMLSTRGGGVTLWMWERTSGELRQLTRRNVEHARPVWLSASRLVCAVPPEGRAPLQATLDNEAASHLMSTWPRAFAARSVTVSVARSTGVPDDDDPRLQGQLLEIDTRTATVRVLAAGAFTSVTPSPDFQWLAAAQATRILRPSGPAPLPNVNPVRYRLALLTTDGQVRASPSVDDIAPGSIRWSASSREIGVNTYTAVTAPAQPVRLERDGQRFRISAASDVPPPGAPVAIPNDAGSLDEATVVWPRTATDHPSARVLRRRNGATATWQVQDTIKGTRSALPTLGQESELAAFEPTSRTAYFREASREGSRLLAAKAGESQARVLLERNMFLATVAEGTLRRLSYVTADGAPAVAWLLLPPGAKTGTRHPTVVWVYGGLVYGETPPPYFVPLNSAGTLNLQLLAARGYAVLLPSIPLGPEGTPTEPLDVIPRAVLPAVDAAIAAGDVDGDRLAVMGCSFGGYAAYGLITQTSRFRAAIVMAGAANLVSLYGQFDPRLRHLATARDRLLAMVFAESGQYRMGRAPTENMDRYVRNSPVTHARHVTTPTLIVQGDLDYVPIQQGEEFFTALYRRSVAAEFVRYWGEGHTIESPPNILDLWDRVFDWLGRYLDNQ